jgi:DNA polymerase-1
MKQIEYLERLNEVDWGKPEPMVELKNDGTAKLTKPQGLNRRITAILNDVYGEKQSDPGERWKKVDDRLKTAAEAEFGTMPVGMLSDVPLQEAVDYAARDADATLRMYYEISPYLRRHGFDKLMADGMELLPVFEEMQSEGMPASRSAFQRLSETMDERMNAIQSKISYHYFDGQPFNPASPDQVAKIMEERNLKGAKRSKKTGKVSTSKKSIEHYRDKDAAVGLIIDWREHAKVRDSFCAPVLERIPEGVERMNVRCEIKMTRVHTRRLAAANPNLLAMPIRNEIGRMVRAGYECAGDEVFGAWDLSQVEMRVMAGLSKDPLLLKLFSEIDPATGKLRDPHTETAARMFGIPVSEVDEIKHRLPAKRVAFGVITSITGAGLYDQLRLAGAGDGWDEDSSDALIKEYFKLYTGVRKYMDECAREVRRNGYIKDKWGMVRLLPGIWSNDMRAKAEAERTASSHVIQGTAQGMIQNSMRWLKPHIVTLQDAGCNVKWQLQVHDELIFRFSQDLWEVMDGLVMEALTEHHGLNNLGVPITAKGHMAKNWAGLK